MEHHKHEEATKKATAKKRVKSKTHIPYTAKDMLSVFRDKHAFYILMRDGITTNVEQFVSDVRRTVCVELDAIYAFLHNHLKEHKKVPRDANAISKRLTSLHRLARASTPPCIPGSGLLHQALRQWVRGDDIAKVIRTLDRHRPYNGKPASSYLFSLGRTPHGESLASLSNVLRVANAVHNISNVEAQECRDAQIDTARKTLYSIQSKSE